MHPMRTPPSRPAPRTVALAAVLVAALAAVLAAAPVLDPAAIVAAAVDAPQHVRNGAAPVGGIETLDLEEQWRAGGEDDEIFFGLIGSAAAHPGGDVYLLDSQLSEIHVYSPSGEHLKILGREGEGPGEFVRGFRLVLLPGDLTGVVMQMPGELITFKPNGDPGPTVRPGDPTKGGMGALWGVQSRAGRMAWYGQSIIPGQGEMTTRDFLIRCTMDGDQGEPLWTKDGKLDLQRAVFVERDLYNLRDRWALDDAGRIFAAVDRDRYAITVYGPDDAVERVIERDYKPRKRTQEENDRIGDGMAVVINGQRLQMEREVEDSDPCIMSLFLDRDGLLWVQTADGDHVGGGVFRRYDVLDREGRFLKQVDLRLPGDPEDDGLYPLGDGRFVLVKGLTAARESAMAGIGGTGGAGGAGDDEDAGGDASPLEVLCFGPAGGL